jgi:hypothetical protein
MVEQDQILVQLFQEPLIQEYTLEAEAVVQGQVLEGQEDLEVVELEAS